MSGDNTQAYLEFLAICTKRLGGRVVISPQDEDEDAIMQGGDFTIRVDERDNYVLEFFPKHMTGTA